MNIDVQYRYTKTYIFNVDSLIKIKNNNKLKIVCRTLKYKKIIAPLKLFKYILFRTFEYQSIY